MDLGARRLVRSDLPPSSISTTVAGPLMGTGESIRSSHPRSAPTAARPGRWPWGELPRMGSGVRSGGSLPRTRPRGPDLSQPVRNSGSTTSASHPARPPPRRRSANWCGSALGSGNEPRRLTQRWRRALPGLCAPGRDRPPWGSPRRDSSCHLGASRRPGHRACDAGPSIGSLVIADPDAVASPAVLVAPMMLAPGRLLVLLLA